MKATYSVDWDFIRNLEGFSKKGYVPVDHAGGIESGVTICAGFDLGQHSKKDMYIFNLSLNLLTKLIPYCGLKGFTAKEYLSKHPLTLTDDEANELDIKVHKTYYDAIQQEYNTNSDYSFAFLDSAKQTVIMSVGFQYGSLKKRCPTFFKYVTKGLWENAVKELRDFGDAYTPRRLKEATLLESSLKKKENNMHAIALVLLFGVMFNGTQPEVHSLAQYHANFKHQFEHPVITPDYTNLNK